jgi:CheY-like chemotaxis protein
VSGHEVLVVEDDDEIRETLVELLQAEGYAVQTAKNGREALEYVRRAERNPCCVLLDLMMPFMNGWEFLEILREEDRIVSLPVVVMTGARDSPDPPGAVRYLKKPVALEALLSIIESLCCSGSRESRDFR